MFLTDASPEFRRQYETVIESMQVSSSVTVVSVTNAKTLQCSRKLQHMQTESLAMVPKIRQAPLSKNQVLSGVRT